VECDQPHQTICRKLQKTQHRRIGKRQYCPKITLDVNFYSHNSGRLIAIDNISTKTTK